MIRSGQCLTGLSFCTCRTHPSAQRYMQAPCSQGLPSSPRVIQTCLFPEMHPRETGRGCRDQPSPISRLIPGSRLAHSLLSCSKRTSWSLVKSGNLDPTTSRTARTSPSTTRSSTPTSA